MRFSLGTRSVATLVVVFVTIGLTVGIAGSSPPGDDDITKEARRILDKEGWDALDAFMSSQGYLHRASRTIIVWFVETEDGEVLIAETVYEGERAHLVDAEKEYQILRESGFLPDLTLSDASDPSSGGLMEDLLAFLDPLPAVCAVHKSYYWLTITCTCYDQNPENGRVTIVGWRQWSQAVSYPADDDGMWVKWNNVYSHLYSHSSDGAIADAGEGAIAFYIDDHDLEGTTAVCIAPNHPSYWGYSATGYYTYHHNWGLWGSLTLGFQFGTPYATIVVRWTGLASNQWDKTAYDQYTIGG